MKYSTAAIASLFAALALAQPAHQHLRRHQDVEWVTEIDWTTTTVGITQTVYVSADESSTAAAPSATTTDAPAQFNQVKQSPSSSSASSTSVYVAPSSSSTSEAPSSTYVAPSSSSTSQEPSSTYVAPSSTYVAPTTSEIPSSTYVAPTTFSTSEAPSSTYVAPSSTSSTAAASSSAASSSGSGASSSGCSESSPCSGDITYYTAGLGACGLTTDGDSEAVIALPYEMMGTQSNGNPYCGQTVTISYGGKTTQATVVDKCMGCTGNSIDLSVMAFNTLADEAIGRAQADWWFN